MNIDGRLIEELREAAGLDREWRHSGEGTTRGAYGAVNGVAAYSPVLSRSLFWWLSAAKEVGRSREEKATRHGSGDLQAISASCGLQCLVARHWASTQASWQDNYFFRSLPTLASSALRLWIRLWIIPTHTMVDPTQKATMDRILQEISAVGRRLEGMDNAISSLTAETKSMPLDIAGFQPRVTGLEQRVTTVKSHITTFQDKD
ncbi:hypothetical protein NDU88_000191 [Pleurodeles waltl]|uniref:Uncharacterized protein n=1 Tax=Pleurodeles waltl TaxID=8319 RepID=A0AAV7TF48_PLEWA|nr:hypothetical protein NDU88_000191 [Pleurodeles waltl]